MSKFELLAYQVVVTVIGFGVFLAFLLGFAVTQGGVLHIDMTLFNEMWVEYWLMFVAVGVLPWALYYLDDRED